MIERTLVLLKPDAVARGYMGELVSRFEKAGLKIVGMKLVWNDEEHSLKHYTEDIAKRRGEHVRKALVDYLKIGPVLAIVLEGVSAIAQARKMVGDTQPKTAAPGTIRGDYAHVSYDYADEKNIPVKNLVHASADEADAKREVALWFKDDELHTYKTVHDVHILE